jgi:hypothetical protein
MTHFLRNLVLVITVNLITIPPAHAHGSAGNGGNFCRVYAQAGELMVSSYQPEISKKAAYCADLPAYTESVIVLDFVTSALRKKALSVQIVEISGKQSQDHSDEHHGRAVQALPFNTYKAGTVQLTFTPEKGKKYATLITILNKHGEPEVIDFPFTFGKKEGVITPNNFATGAFFLLAFGMFLVFFRPLISKNKKA